MEVMILGVHRWVTDIWMGRYGISALLWHAILVGVTGYVETIGLFLGSDMKARRHQL